MNDPLSEVVALLKPSAPFAKLSSAAGQWCVRRGTPGQPSYFAILEGSCRLLVDGHDPIVLQKGDFALVPSPLASMMSSLVPPRTTRDSPRVQLPSGEYRLGDPNAPADVRMLVGHCVFASADAALLVSLLPQLVHVRGHARLQILMELLREESREMRPARDVILTRLLEVLLIETLRCAVTSESASPGLVRGLTDERLARAIRCIHESPTRTWTVAELAKASALSRSAFFERFARAVGVTPMEYLLRWRMALAKDMLIQRTASVAEVAEKVGYGSASTFSVAFTRHVGQPPTHFAREHLNV